MQLKKRSASQEGSGRRSRRVVKAITRVSILALPGDKDAGPRTWEMEASAFETTQFNPHFTGALGHQATCWKPLYSLRRFTPGRECTHQQTGRASLPQSFASLYKLMNWYLTWNISLRSLVNVWLFIDMLLLSGLTALVSAEMPGPKMLMNSPK